VFSYMMAGNLISDGWLEAEVSPITILEMSLALATLGVMGELLMRDISNVMQVSFMRWIVDHLDEANYWRVLQVLQVLHRHRRDLD
jgi:hypothetical protein